MWLSQSSGHELHSLHLQLPSHHDDRLLNLKGTLGLTCDLEGLRLVPQNVHVLLLKALCLQDRFFNFTKTGVAVSSCHQEQTVDGASVRTEAL